MLGGQDFIYSQASGVEEGLFKGEGVLGVMADAATMDFRERAGARSLAEVDASLHVPERLLSRLAVHVARCYLGGGGRQAGGGGGQSPLILGVWGPKGGGKTFSVEVAMKKMGVRVVALSAGELEDGRAGEVSLRIRQRYALCKSIVEAEGEAAALVISDLDAGLGRSGAQMTVNTQNAVAELMALCDGVLPAEVRRDAARPGARVPIIVTANDLTRCYAPLLRDGRMDKFFWEPDAEEKSRVLHATAEGAGVDLDEVRALVADFPEQPLDFFAAAHARLPDGAVRGWLARTGLGFAADAIMDAYDARMGYAAVDLCRDLEEQGAGAGEVLAAWRSSCWALAVEQQRVLDENLSREYFKNHDGLGIAAGRERAAEEEVERRRVLRRQAAADERKRAATASSSESRPESLWSRMSDEERRATLQGPSEPEVVPGPEPEASPWRIVDAEGAKILLDEEGYIAVDIRSRRAFRSEALKGARSCPAVDVEGFSLDAVEHDRPDWLAEFTSLAEELGGKVLLLGDGEPRAEERAQEAWEAAGAEGEALAGLAELRGGYPAWLVVFSPAGKRRQKGKWGTPGSEEHDYWTASN